MDVERDFQSKMRNIVAQRTKRKREVARPANVKSAVSLEEFANVINEGRKERRLVVVRFHATWCKVRGKGYRAMSFFLLKVFRPREDCIEYLSFHNFSHPHRLLS
jgi:hypothetical protein